MSKARATVTETETRVRSLVQRSSTAVNKPAPAATRQAKRKPASRRATIRTYRHGLGDCHLITLHGKNATTYRILIDCGVVLGTEKAASQMDRVMASIVKDSDGIIDLLVATHEHWDHLSGFVQAKSEFDRLTVKKVWMGWTEDPNDPQARTLRKERNDALGMLRLAAAHLQLTGTEQEWNTAMSMLEFFGAAGGLSTKAALEAVRNKTKKPRYCDPADPPTELPDFGARIYVLGPPRDEKKLKKILPSKKYPEAYHLAMASFQDNVLPGLTDSVEERPFNTLYSIPDTAAKEMPFFQKHYWDDNPWRSVDVAWMGDTEQFALALDSMTNNTSLVLAIEIEDVGVLLFAADAQVGNWLSWAELEWKVAGQEVTGPDLLRRTIFYKVGHHGSHNATLHELGLELMQNLRIAVVPVDHDMAVKKRWGKIPLPTILAVLEEMTKDRGYVLRTDEEPSTEALKRGVERQPDYFEIQF